MIQPGLRISEYVLEDKIGAGACGEVWRGRHHVWGEQVVAIKFPHDVQYIRDLQREGLVIKGLDHPNIVRAIGFDPYASPPYLVMEYIPGKSLRQLIREKKVSLGDAQRIMSQILQGLEHAHSRGLIHRDLKPENVLVACDPDGKISGGDNIVKITDFGFGQRASNAPGSIAYSLSVQGDQAARIVGTLDYMSPEQKTGEPIDARSDLYACGVILFELLTGDRPSGTEAPGDLVPGVPEHLNDVFKRAYTRLDRRYQSVEEMRRGMLPALPAKKIPEPQRPPTGMISCPRCQRGVGSKDQFCMYCGVQLVKLITRCTRCGAYPDPDDQFCTQCGQTLVRMRLAT